MKVIIQRVKSASCTVDNNLVSSIKEGFMILVGFKTTDTIDLLDKAIYKITNLRIFEDELGKMNKSILDIKGEILSISQFTLYANTSNGHRPSFTEALNPESANELYLEFNKRLNNHVKVYPGIFGASMDISLINSGPVTIVYEF